MKHLLTPALVFIFLGSLMACTDSSSGDSRQANKAEVTEEELKECSSKMNIIFPASTRPLNIYKVTGWLDDSIYLKIEIERKDLDALIKNSPFADIELRSDRRYVYKERTLSWWDPEGVSNYKSGQASLPDAKYLNILLDFDRNERITVYLDWSET